jgi:diazepam-binding inhibitor (GABA receptor modulating acyl-CoA-binding protein)
MELEQQFDQAVADSKNLSTKPDNNTLLRMYSLYKQATFGDNTESGPANALDMVARMKHEAWAKLGGISKEDAMQLYVDLVNELKG